MCWRKSPRDWDKSRLPHLSPRLGSISLSHYIPPLYFTDNIFSFLLILDNRVNIQITQKLLGCIKIQKYEAMQRSKYRMQQNIMRKNILPKLAVEKRKEVPKHFFIFVVIVVSVVSVVSVAVFFIVPHPMVSTPTLAFRVFFYRMHCVSFHNCKGKSFRPAMEMSLSANKETGQSLKEKRKSTMKESFLVFL